MFSDIGKGRLAAEKAEAYRQGVSRIIGSMPPEAVKHLNAGLKGGTFYDNLTEVNNAYWQGKKGRRKYRVAGFYSLSRGLDDLAYWVARFEMEEASLPSLDECLAWLNS
jgi:hypothetical protein